ncbi:hypothetical protein GYMLUDRAFT_55548 [Collybiopsis luxurians FD-317 M1]|nr:hypothetical protein GYMLUDRAFT_55548 [Collybiopsis luxurians FD-317 M1]
MADIQSVLELTLQRLDKCTKCGSDMSDYCVYQRAEPGKAHLLGTIVQTYSMVKQVVANQCTYTKKHTTVPYYATDAERLVQRLNARHQGLPIPATASDMQLQLAPLCPIIDASQSIVCSKGCIGKTTGRATHANTACIELLCKPCCINAHADAQDNQLSQNPCKCHGLPAVDDPLPAQLTIQTPTDPSISIPPPLLPTVPIPHVLPPCPPAQIHQVAAQLPPSANPTTSQSPHQHSSLAQSITQNWLENYNVAQQRLDEEEKCKVNCVIWPKAGEPLLQIPFVFPSFPLTTLQALVEFLNLDIKSLFDHFNFEQAQWLVIGTAISITVSKDQNILLQLHTLSALLETIKVTDYPEMAEELELQPQISKLKCNQADPSQVLMSPLKKVLKPDNPSTDISQARPTSPSLSINSPSVQSYSNGSSTVFCHPLCRCQL